MPRFSGFLFAVLVVIALVGCSKEPLSKVEQFKVDHAATNTPHGPFDMDSAVETPSGVRVNTKDGTPFKVEMEKAQDGTTKYVRTDRADK